MDIKKLSIKVKTGINWHTISLEEAHKAYRIFLNPNERAVFENGLGIRGQDIISIEPDYHASMGWNATHQLDGDDWHDIRSNGVDRKLRDYMVRAKDVALSGEMELLKLPLSQVVKELPASEEWINNLAGNNEEDYQEAPNYQHAQNDLERLKLINEEKLDT